jgi:RND family efflux transporter MFP subunit
MKKLPVLCVIAALLGGGWYVLKDRLPHGPKEQADAENLTAIAEKRDLDFSVEISGDVTPATQLDVKSEVGGKLKVLHVIPGQTVKEGELLVEIDDTDLLTEKDSAETEIEGARLSMGKAKNNYERSRDLFEQKLISKEVFDNLTAEFQIAENGLVKAQRKLQLVTDKLRKTKVIAPGEGTVLTVPVIEGQVVIAAASVNNGTTLMTVANLSKLLVETHINQVDVAKLELNQDVKLRAESLKDLELEATISFIAPVATVKNNVKGFQVQALIEKPNPRLRPGMTVNMSIPIATATDAISVPISAVFKGEGKKKVIYVRNGESTEQREVKIGVTNTDHAQIIKGVQEGEEVMLVEPGRMQAKKS